MNLIYVYNTCIHTIVLRYSADKSFICCSWVVWIFATLWTVAKPGFLCSPLTPGVCWNSSPLSWWCYLTTSFSAALLSLYQIKIEFFFFRYVSYFHSNHSNFCWGNIFQFYHCPPSWIMLLLLYLKTFHQTQSQSDFLLCFHLEVL